MADHITFGKTDYINQPDHYTGHPSGVECIQITEHMNFNLGNVVKYLWRVGKKGPPLDDLKKARWYLDREIKRRSPMKLYLIGSLRNPEIPRIGNKLRELGFDVFDDWFAAGPEADDYWKEYEEERGGDYFQALKGIACNHVFGFDQHHLDTCDMAVLVLPAGRSGHLELGYVAGQGKPTFILADEELGKSRWDVMYRFATDVSRDEAEMLAYLRGYKDQVDTIKGDPSVS